MSILLAKSNRRAISNLEETALKSRMCENFNYIFNFINKAEMQINYTSNKFPFGFKRILRLRQPNSKYL